MAKYDLIVADPPWEFADTLTMSDTPRGAASNYSVLDIEAIKNLEVSKVTADNAVLVLWIPSAMLQDGLDTMKNWGFDQKQTFIWVKIKQTAGIVDPLKGLHKQLRGLIREERKKDIFKASNVLKGVKKLVNEFDINNILSFYLGHLFRQTHELALIGTKGSVYGDLAAKNQRSVILDRNLGHSSKPEGLQDRLDLMFPKAKKLEMFARRVRPDWDCVGWECPSKPKEDIRDSIKRLERL
jgi:N6-adenosine-specific RNA methylase IME4